MAQPKNVLQFLKPKSISKKINGENVKFFAAPVRILFDLSDLATPLLNSMIQLFKDKSLDSGRVIQDYESVIDGEQGAKTEFMPLDVDAARYRDGATSDSVAKLVSALSDERTKMLVGNMVMSSMREVFEPEEGGFSDDSILEFMNNADLDVETMSSLCAGSLEACKGMLGPLGDLAAQMVGLLKDRMVLAVDNVEKALTPTKKA